ncbi:MAG: hypothetical protein LBG06_03830 [Deltaproteobacteria bacterium]|jgi:hypothetical protein|nr:hypothetical protein [Deltaproteobacteria bacterium]
MPFPFIPVLLAAGAAFAAGLGVSKRRAAREGTARAKALDHANRRILIQGHSALQAARREAAASLAALGADRLALASGPMLAFARALGEPAARAASGDRGRLPEEILAAFPAEGPPAGEVSGACESAFRFESEIAAPSAAGGGPGRPALVQIGALGPRLVSDIVWFSPSELVFKGYFNPTVDWLAGILPEASCQEEPGGERRTARAPGDGAPAGARDALLGGALPPWLSLPAKSILRAARAEEAAGGALFGRGRSEEAADAMRLSAAACRAAAAHAEHCRAALAPLAAGLGAALRAMQEAAAGGAAPGTGPAAAFPAAAREACRCAVAADRLFRHPLLRADGSIDDGSLAALREAEISDLVTGPGAFRTGPFPAAPPGGVRDGGGGCGGLPDGAA